MSTSQNDAGLRVKWADRVRIFLSAGADPQEMPDAHAMPLPDLYQVEDLAKTEEEVAAIRETVDALNEFLGVICGSEPQCISEERVHIVTEEEFRKKVSPQRAQGKSRTGHVYLYRGWPLPEFQALLAHELMHAVAYLWLDLRTGSARTEAGLAWPKMVERRQGMVLIDPSYGTWLPHFHGLNESITETSAVLIRQMLAKRSRLLDEAGRVRLAGFVASPPLVAFMDRLLKVAAEPSGDAVAAWKAALMDDLHGTDDFLAMLDAQLPGAKEILRCTGARPDELIFACGKLGFDDLAAAFLAYVP